MQGRIIKATGAQFVVSGPEGQLVCRARGRFRLEGEYPLVGDFVTAMSDGTGEGYGVISEVAPRQNRLIRPPVANVDRLLIVASLAPPVTPLALVDYLTTLAEYHDIVPVICFNKTDIEDAQSTAAMYHALGYPAMAVSAVTGEGLSDLAEAIDDGLTVLTGYSGVGKTSLLNALIPGFSARTGEISEKIGRGRQTTRHVELLPFGQGYVADTPGYSSFDAVEMEMTEKERLPWCFVEFRDFLGQCKYNDCTHVSDEGCAILQALKDGRISPSRHESYTDLYERLKDVRQWQLKKK
jgi:ribosome biogenesis GTPase